MAKKKISGIQELSLSLSEQLKKAARNPDINRYVPHYKQKIFHSSEKPGRQFIGGNRSGKTVAGGCEVVYYATGKHPFKKLPWEPPVRLRVVTVDFVEGLEKIVLPEIKKWMPVSELINNSWEDSYSPRLRTLTLKNGSFIEFMSFEQDLEKFAGTSRHGIWFDEEPPKSIFTECKLRLLDTEGHWWMTMTPVEGMTWTLDDIYEANDPYIDIVEVDMDENPHLTEMGKAIALSGLSDEDVMARKHGRYVSLGGTIYQNQFQSVSVIDEIIPPLDWLWFNGMDAGFTNPTCWLWGATDETGRIIIFDEWYQSNMIVAEHAKVVNERNSRVGRRPPDYNVGDPSIKNTDPITRTSVLIEYEEHGIDILLANNDIRAGIDRVKKYMIGKGDGFPMIFITRNCVKLLWEINRYRWATWKNKNDQYQKNKKEEPLKKDDHACDALRYMVASRPELEIVAPPERPTNFLGASVAVSQEGLKDTGLLVPRRPYSDDHLGADF